MDRIIVVARIADLPEPCTPAERSLCAWCGAPVWLGHAVRIYAPFGTPVCVPCVFPTIDPADTLTITPGVRRERTGWPRTRRRD